MLDWTRIESKYANRPLLRTLERRKPFRITRVTENAIYVQPELGLRREYYISRKNLEKAAELIDQGKIRKVADYRREVADQRPTYALAILADLGIFKPT